MIEGDGFFVTRGTGGEQLFTRAGSFDFDAAGKLVTPDGSVLQGWMADADGVVNPNGPIGDLSVPYGQIVDPAADAPRASSTGNLPVGRRRSAPSVQTGITMYDSQGVAQKVFYNFTKTAAEHLDARRRRTRTATSCHRRPRRRSTPPAKLIDPRGPLRPQPARSPRRPAYPSWTGPVTIDIAGADPVRRRPTPSATAQQDGYALGSLQSFQLGADGTIMGVYSNELRQPIGRLALASFNNPGGLEKAGNSSFRVGVNSGVAQVGTAGVRRPRRR